MARQRDLKGRELKIWSPLWLILKFLTKEEYFS